MPIIGDLDGFQGDGFVDITRIGETDLCSRWNAVDHLHSAWAGSVRVSLTSDDIPLPQGTVTVVRNKVKESADNGIIVCSTGVTLERDSVQSCAKYGLFVERHGNDIRANEARGGPGRRISWTRRAATSTRGTGSARGRWPRRPTQGRSCGNP